jgi:hypothetical protein
MTMTNGTRTHQCLFWSSRRSFLRIRQVSHAIFDQYQIYKVFAAPRRMARMSKGVTVTNGPWKEVRVGDADRLSLTLSRCDSSEE